MLLSLFTLIVILVSSLSLARLVEAWMSSMRRLVPSPLWVDRQFSFLSLILFLFFPSAKDDAQVIAKRRHRQPFF